MLGIIILNYRTWDISIRCMKNIADTIGELPYHIYLVDNASPNPMPDECKKYLEKNEEQISFLQAEKNRGYAAGNNIGIRQALKDNCEYLLITNNDIVFTKQAIYSMLEGFTDIKTGIVGPKVLGEKGEVQTSRCSMKTGIKEVFQVFTIGKKIFRKKWEQYYCLNQDADQQAEVYYVSGCCFMMTRQCAIAVTPFDEGTVLYNEEMILGIRMEECGFKTCYYPKSVVIHQHGATTNQIQPFMYQCICQSELYYCSKYLQAKKWQIWLLYHYRRVLYWLRSMRDKRLREYWEVFARETKVEYRNCSGHTSALKGKNNLH